MKHYLWQKLLRFLLWYVDLPHNDTAKSEDYFAAAWMSPGFRSHLAYRDDKIKFEIAGGIGMKEKERDDLIRLHGQRAENLILGAYAKNCYMKKLKETERLREKQKVEEDNK